MADTKTSDLAAASVLADNDLLMMVDVSDTTMAGTGTNKKVVLSNVRSFLMPTFAIFMAQNFR